MNVLIWAEDRPLKEHELKMRELYPNGIEKRLSDILAVNEDMCIITKNMQDDEQGFSESVLDWADVLVLWSHKHWRELEDIHVKAVCKRVREGMGLVVLHSAHASKIFSELLGTKTQQLHWRENDERQRYYIVSPKHPIASGIQGEYFDIPMDETYWEFFDIPQPDEQIFISCSKQGEVFRSGCVWRREKGTIFYFQGGHETYPVYYQKEVMDIITNAVRYCTRSNV